MAATLILGLYGYVGWCYVQVKNPASAEMAPLPNKVVSARTVFLINETGTAKFGDSMYRLLRKWNRWEVVTDRAKADLLLVLSQRDTVEGAVSTGTATATGQTASGTAISVPMKTSSWFLHVVDAGTGEKLWTAQTAMGGKLWRSWTSVAKSLLSDVQKRMK